VWHERRWWNSKRMCSRSSRRYRLARGICSQCSRRRAGLRPACSRHCRRVDDRRGPQRASTTVGACARARRHIFVVADNHQEILGGVEDVGEQRRDRRTLDRVLGCHVTTAPWRKRSRSPQIALGISTVRVLLPLPNTVTWPPSVRGCRSRHLRSATLTRAAPRCTPHAAGPGCAAAGRSHNLRMWQLWRAVSWRAALPRLSPFYAFARAGRQLSGLRHYHPTRRSARTGNRGTVVNPLAARQG
jgi:hypothetical protein